MKNYANQQIQFEAEEEINGEGDIVCRKCGRKIKLSVRILNLIFFSASRVKVEGKWCNHSHLRQMIEEIIFDNSLSVENDGYF